MKSIFKKTIVTVSVDLYIKVTILKKLLSKAVNEKGAKKKKKEKKRLMDMERELNDNFEKQVFFFFFFLFLVGDERN